MTKANVIKLKTLRDRVTEAEWQARVDLAACYRLAHHFGMTDLIYTHISARVPGPDEHFLINPYGLLFNEISASSLIKVDLEGAVVLKPDLDYPVNQAGFVIHSAVHAARADVRCVMHTHTRAGIALSALACGLLPLTQTAMRFHGRIGYHDYEGPAVDLDERQRLVAHLAEHSAMVLRHHGLLAAGASVAETFNIMFWLERACQAQIDAMACNTPLHLPKAAVAAKAAHLYDPRVRRRFGDAEWPTMLRLLDQTHPGYAA